jgi:hypothetical protein
MTADGNHGGTSPLETEAALFVFSPRPLFSSVSNVPLRVKQVDLVPTLSVLMGVPIPFARLGMIIASIFEDITTVPDRSVQLLHHLEAFRVDCWQVQTYLHEYATISQIFDDEVMQILTTAFLEADTMHLDIVTRYSENYPIHLLEDIIGRFADVLARSGVFCRAKWTTQPFPN